MLRFIQYFKQTIEEKIIFLVKGSLDKQHAKKINFGSSISKKIDLKDQG
jgi:hypothetical protein